MVRTKARPRLPVKFARGYARVCDQSRPAVLSIVGPVTFLTPKSGPPATPARHGDRPPAGRGSQDSAAGGRRGRPA